MTMKIRTTTLALAALGTAGVVLVGCANADPLADESAAPAAGGEGSTLLVGSQDYYSNEIIAELYAQALEDAGYDIDRQLRIGQREAYMPQVEAGEIDLFPEYSGPLLQYWADEAPEERQSQEVYDALVEAAPEGLTILEQAPATDQDAYVVTRAFAEEYDLDSIDDLANVDQPLVMGANSEAETRPNGPQGLQEVYGIEVGFTPIEDGGGPLTIRALEDGDIQLAIVYTADPTIAQNDLVVLDDPEGLFLASHVVPVASGDVDEQAQEIVDEVSAALTPEALLELNRRSVEEESPAADIAGTWLEEQGLVG